MLKWNGEVGPAFIAILLAAAGALWWGGHFQGQVESALLEHREAVKEAKEAAMKSVAAVSAVKDSLDGRLRAVTEQDARLGKVETAMGFVTSAIARIEEKLDKK